jgi:RimJ/RimL family protein N-acetyltransferase
VVERVVIDAEWLTLRPFDRADIPWVLEVSSDPAVQHFVEVPSPYRHEHAAWFVEKLAIAGWELGKRAEFLVAETATGRRLARVGLWWESDGAGEIGYWADPAARGRGVTSTAVRAVCRWGFAGKHSGPWPRCCGG